MNALISREPVFQEADFIGRRVEMQWMNNLLGRTMPENGNLTGEPRIGKTSFLYQIAAQKVGLKPGQRGVYVLMRLVTLPNLESDAFWRLMYAQLRDTAVAAGFTVEMPAVPAEDVRDLFDELDEAVELLLQEEACHRLIFLIDDFDLLLPGITARDLDWMRAWATRYGQKLAFIITSSDPLVKLTEGQVQRGGANDVSPFENMLHERSLGLLTVDEALLLCQKTAVAEHQPPLSEADCQFLLQEVGPHPALLKIACSYLFEAQQYGRSANLFTEVSNDIRLDSHVNWLFRQLWQRRTPAEQQILTAVAHEQPVAESITLSRLRKHLSLVQEVNEQNRLFANAFAAWIRQQNAAMTVTAVEPPPPPTKEEPSLELQHLPTKRMVLVGEEEIHLTQLENRLISYLIQHKNEVCTIEELLDAVWGAEKTRSVVEKAINRLRTKIEHDPKRPRFILSARGEGYLLRLE